MVKLFVYLGLAFITTFFSYMMVLYLVLVSEIGFKKTSLGKVIVFSVTPIIWLSVLIDKDVFIQSNYRKRYVFLIKMFFITLTEFDLLLGYTLNIVLKFGMFHF
jgi:hypothetical protein